MTLSDQALVTTPRLRHAIKLALDCLLGVAAWSTASALSRGDVDSGPWMALQWGLIALLVSYTFQLSRQHYRLIGFRDFIRIVLAETCLLIAAWILRLVYGQTSPGIDTWLIAAILTAPYWVFLRALFRAVNEISAGYSSKPQKRTLIVGAGRAGVLVADEVQRHRELSAKVVGFIDDDPTKQGLRIHGIPVLGPQELLTSIVKEENIEQVVLAIPSATGPQMRRLAERTQYLEVQVKTVPGIFNLLGNQTWKPELRDVSIEDLLRREPVDLDQERLAPILEDQVVLVTGAGGSIGSEICRQVCQFRPSRLILLGRGENSLWIIERELRQSFPNQPLSLELCDIRNPRRLEQVFERRNPSVVFHAAAHKHVPYLEKHPEEAVENNIFGTSNVLEVAIRFQIQHFVNI